MEKIYNMMWKTWNQLNTMRKKVMKIQNLGILEKLKFKKISKKNWKLEIFKQNGQYFPK